MAPPRKKIDLLVVKQLASIGCPATEIAAELGVNVRTIERQYAAILKAGLERRNARIRKTLFQQAMTGNTAILIFLAKVWLHMKDESESALTVNHLSITIGAPEAKAIEAEAKPVREKIEGMFKQYRPPQLGNGNANDDTSA